VIRLAVRGDPGATDTMRCAREMMRNVTSAMRQASSHVQDRRCTTDEVSDEHADAWERNKPFVCVRAKACLQRIASMSHMLPWLQRRAESIASLVTLDSALKSPRERFSRNEVALTGRERSELDTCESITTEFSRIGSTEPADDGCFISKESQRGASEQLDHTIWEGQMSWQQQQQQRAQRPEEPTPDGARTPALRCTDESIESLATPLRDLGAGEPKKLDTESFYVNEALEQAEEVLGLLDRYWQAEQRYGCQWVPSMRQPYCWWSATAHSEVQTRSAVELGRKRAAFTRIAWRSRARQVESILRHAPSRDSAVAAIMFLDRGMTCLFRSFADTEPHDGRTSPRIRLLQVGIPLVALASLWVATKIHEREAGDVETWLLSWPAEESLRMTKSPYEGYQPPISLPLVKAAELVLLDALNWDLVPATPLHFAMAFAAIGSVHCEGVRALMIELCCLSLLEPAIAGRYPPSVIGLGCLLSAIRIREHPVLVECSGAVRYGFDYGTMWAQEALGVLVPNGDVFFSVVEELETILRELIDPVPPSSFSRSLPPRWSVSCKSLTGLRKRSANISKERKSRRVIAHGKNPLKSEHTGEASPAHSKLMENATDWGRSSFERIWIDSTASDPTIPGPVELRPHERDLHVDACRSMLQRFALCESGRCRQDCAECLSVP
jgi:hypothetical protein